MNRWFRFYDDAINDPKVLSLPEALRWPWVALLCAASKNDGKLPSTDHLAIMLRIPKARVAAIIAALVAVELIDNTAGGFKPHNWEGRQYKSDSSAERTREYRKRHRSAKSDDSDDECDVTGDMSSDVTVTVQSRDRTDTESESEIAVAVDARATGAKISSEAQELADKLQVIAGHGLGLATPPGWCGAAGRVQKWLNEGWDPEIIIAAVKATAARKHGPPANSVQFFEKAIAEEVARQAAPLPVINVKERETINVTAEQRNKPESLGDVARRQAAAGISFGPKPTGLPSKPEGSAAVRLISQG